MIPNSSLHFSSYLHVFLLFLTTELTASQTFFDRSLICGGDDRNFIETHRADIWPKPDNLICLFKLKHNDQILPRQQSLADLHVRMSVNLEASRAHCAMYSATLPTVKDYTHQAKLREFVMDDVIANFSRFPLGVSQFDTYTDGRNMRVNATITWDDRSKSLYKMIWNFGNKEFRLTDINGHTIIYYAEHGDGLHVIQVNSSTYDSRQVEWHRINPSDLHDDFIVVCQQNLTHLDTLPIPPQNNQDPFYTTSICGGNAISNDHKLMFNTSHESLCVFLAPELPEFYIILEGRRLDHRFLVSAAQQYCSRYRATLPVITNRDIFNKVAAFMKKIKVASVPLGISKYVRTNEETIVHWDNAQVTKFTQLDPLRFEHENTPMEEKWQINELGDNCNMGRNLTLFDTDPWSWVTREENCYRSTIRVLCQQNLTELHPLEPSAPTAISTAPTTTTIIVSATPTISASPTDGEGTVDMDEGYKDSDYDDDQAYRLSGVDFQILVGCYLFLQMWLCWR